MAYCDLAAYGSAIPPRYQSLLESTRAIPWEFDLAEGRFTYIGPQIEALLGYPLSAWYQSNFWPEHMHPEDQKWAPLFCSEATQRGEDYEFEYRMLAADGRIVWLRDYVNIISGPTGPVGIRGFLFDITEQKQAQDVMELLARTSSMVDPDEFFQACVRNLARAYGARFAFIGLLLDSRQDVRTLAVWAGDGFAPNFEYNLEGTPCRDILDLKKELIPRDASRLYADDMMLVRMGVDSYFGVPLIAASGQVLGLISVMDTKPMELTRWTAPLLGVFASRVAVELERKAATDSLRDLNASLEQHVRQRTAELEAANQELEAFSYSVSHDLRAPLRTVDGFSQALIEDYGSQLDATAKNYLERVRASAQYMGTLIDGMLRLSRLSRAALQPEEVDLSEMAREIVAQLHETDPARNARVDIADGLRCHGDRGLLWVVLENLLNNAWKYTRRRADTHIEFGSTKLNGETVYFVRDNGAGFDMKYDDKLFGAFQRLHRADEFEGTGIGLATVQRIIHRHLGRVWAEAELNKGATFFFTISSVMFVQGSGN